MRSEVKTCWGLVQEAAEGRVDAREQFARLYEPVVRSYLAARWRARLLVGSVDDAIQDVFVELFRSGGALEKLDVERGSEFRAYLLGVVRNVARRYEQKAWKECLDRLDPNIRSDDTSIASVFDRAWAESMLKEAARVQAQEAEKKGPAAVRRVALLRLRFHDELPIREIAKRWSEPDELVHREYAKARKEFHAALKDVVLFQRPGATETEITKTCEEILQLIKRG